MCIQKAATSCSVIDSVPADWDYVLKYKDNGVIKEASCAEIVGCNSCESCGF
ncbi:MAG: hypothetical protein ABIJ92_01835 [Candidatus Aenigmatarchaeota archaeon]